MTPNLYTLSTEPECIERPLPKPKGVAVERRLLRHRMEIIGKENGWTDAQVIAVVTEILEETNPRKAEHGRTEQAAEERVRGDPASDGAGCTGSTPGTDQIASASLE